MDGGGAKETRTLDLRDANAALCQLSYRPADDYRQAWARVRPLNV